MVSEYDPTHSNYQLIKNWKELIIVDTFYEAFYLSQCLLQYMLKVLKVIINYFFFMCRHLIWSL